MKSSRNGAAIMLVRSVFVELDIDDISLWGASKGGLNALALAAAVEPGADGNRANTVNPTVIRAPSPAAASPAPTT